MAVDSEPRYPTLVFGGTGAITFINFGTGASTVHGASGSVTVQAGDGGGIYSGGTNGGNMLSAGAGQVTLFAGGDGDQLSASGSGADYLVGSTGNETLNAAGTGNDILQAGSGRDVMIAGMGADVFAFAAGSGGTTTVAGFKEGVDHIALLNFGQAAVDAAVSAATAGAGGVSLTLFDATRITIVGVSKFSAADILPS